MPLNSPVMTAHAGNVYVDADAAHTITYSLGVGSNTMFQINANTGAVTTSAAIRAASINPQTFNSLVVLVATDSFGNSNSAKLFMQLQGTDVPPVFNPTSY